MTGGMIAMYTTDRVQLAREVHGHLRAKRYNDARELLLGVAPPRVSPLAPLSPDDHVFDMYFHLLNAQYYMVNDRWLGAREALQDYERAAMTRKLSGHEISEQLEQANTTYNFLAVIVAKRVGYDLAARKHFNTLKQAQGVGPRCLNYASQVATMGMFLPRWYLRRIILSVNG
jgi:hypothetical protein